MFEDEPFSKKTFLFFIIASGVLAFSASHFAHSAEVESSLSENNQPADEGDREDSRYVRSLNAVTVIGSRLPSFQIPFADVPANVSYIPANASRKNKEQIYVSKPRTIQESVKDLESVVLYDQVGNGVDTTFSLRGFNESSSVITIVDGVRVNEVDGDSVNYPLISMHDLEAIQVDRGSASPIFGNNAFAGVVHITTGRPSEEPISFFGGFEYSSFRGIRFNQGVSGTIYDDFTSLDGAFKYYFNAGRTNNRGFTDNGEFRSTDFDIKTEYHLPDEQGRFFVHVKHVDQAISNPGALTFQQWQDNPASSRQDLDGRYRENTIVSIGADKKFFDDHIAVSILASTRYNDVDFYTTFQTFTDFADGFNPDTNLVETKSRATDLVWQLAYQDEWDWLQNQSVIGMEMRDADNTATQRDAFLGILRPTAIEADRTSEPKNVGLFWRETLKFANVVIAHFGMRHDHHWLETNDHVTNLEIDGRWRKNTYSTGITIRPIESADVFFNYSQGFRVPTISEIAPFSGTVSQGLRPENSDSYEAGFRLRYNKIVESKMSFFVIDLKDEILFDSTTRTALAPFGQNVNVGETRRTGIELRVDAKPIEEIEAYASYTWTQAWVRESNPTGSFVDGRSLGQIPEHRWTLGLTTRPLARVCEKCKGLKVGLYGTYTGKQHPQSFESNSQAVLNATGGAGHFIKPYSLWDFLLAYEFLGQEVYFKINNIFDERYYSRAINATSFGTALQPAGTFTFVNGGAPREFLFGARWELDHLADLFMPSKS